MKLQPEKYFDGEMLELGRAIVANDEDKIESLIKSRVDPNAYGKQGITPLIFALGNRKMDALQTLLKNGADPNKRIDAPDAPPGVQGESAVTFVAGAPDNEYLATLLDHGGDPNAKNIDGEPILIRMIYTDPANYIGMKMLLDRKADINITDAGGATLLMNLTILKDFEHAYYLLEKGADFRIKDGTGYGPEIHIYQYKIDPKAFPKAYEWQRKCQEFLAARGVKDPGPLRPKVLTAEEEEENKKLLDEMFEKDAKRREEYQKNQDK
ncbi:ankyrin repeat domain-containing protein [Geobacter benzoatilyticus]|uniref:Ankyrin repeat domain-containing protein n=1 Tax=Geobacter benzoatilyticus TaxID=2815309 RepID=A0ABX7Q510_9BACT|nr:ankyrin repeat domain-containing protein [Geobacter benzoatilyticus]QSV46537.1 ankyrin repeat domain-containing protein [Geobacter benzoatilyticus]